MPGDQLNIFKDNSLDYVISRHCLEHFQDPIKAILEWKRVLKIGGILGVSMPDDSLCNSISLDPSHKHVFTPISFERIINLIGQFQIIKIKQIPETCSFVFIAKKVK